MLADRCEGRFGEDGFLTGFEGRGAGEVTLPGEIRAGRLDHANDGLADLGPDSVPGDQDTRSAHAVPSGRTALERQR